jgi:hypothetical protein
MPLLRYNLLAQELFAAITNNRSFQPMTGFVVTIFLILGDQN